MLNPGIAVTLLMFDIANYRKYMCLSSNWNFLIQEGIDILFKRIELDFISKYYEHLAFKSSYTSSSMIYASGVKGVRVDRVLVCEVLNNSRNLNSCLRASYAYRINSQKHYDDYLYNQPQSDYYAVNEKTSNFQHQRRQKEQCAIFKMDILAAGS